MRETAVWGNAANTIFGRDDKMVMPTFAQQIQWNTPHLFLMQATISYTTKGYITTAATTPDGTYNHTNDIFEKYLGKSFCLVD